MLPRKLITVIFLLFLLSGTRLSAQGWIVPEENREKAAPFRFTGEMQQQGENLYLKNCQSCHGLPGKNNFAKLMPSPGDLSGDRVRLQTDGEIFYRITTGKTPMPEFRNILSKEERWWIISFLRTFHRGYKQPEPTSKADFSGKKVLLVLDYLKEKNKVSVTAFELSDKNSKTPLKGAGIILSVKRYFGNMQLGDPKVTNEKGIATFDFPGDLPGDKAGMVDLMAGVNDPSGHLAEARVTGRFRIGVPADIPGLTSTRAWWSTRDKAPVWVIMTYSSAVLITWGFIFYIFISIFKIRKLNKLKNQNQ
jgi:mono/diheme cytochrome c family protein